MSNIHRLNLAHRDIKCENILLSEDFRLKLCDFGACCTIDNQILQPYQEEIVCPMEAVGSPEYNAPEVLAGG